MPEVQTQVHDSAASLNAEILEALMDDVRGAVRPDGPPSLLEVVDASAAADGESIDMAVKTYQDAGIVPIYDIETGARSFTSVNMLPAQLRKLNAEGKRMFTHRPPTRPPAVGEMKCWLHPEHPDGKRAEYDALGLPTCRKGNLPSPYQVELHMRHRHPTAYETLERVRQKQERDEERAWQKQIAMAAVGRQNPVVEGSDELEIMRPKAQRTNSLAEQAAAGPQEPDVAPGVSATVKRGPFGRPIKQA